MAQESWIFKASLPPLFLTSSCDLALCCVLHQHPLLLPLHLAPSCLRSLSWISGIHLWGCSGCSSQPGQTTGKTLKQSGLFKQKCVIRSLPYHWRLLYKMVVLPWLCWAWPSNHHTATWASCPSWASSSVPQAPLCSKCLQSMAFERNLRESQRSRQWIKRTKIVKKHKECYMLNTYSVFHCLWSTI